MPKLTTGILCWVGALVLLTWAQNPDSYDEFFNSILYTQYDTEAEQCANTPEAITDAPTFEGGDNFFNTRFVPLIQQIQNHAATLKTLNISMQGGVAPSITITDPIYRDLKDTFAYPIEKVEIMIGIDQTLRYCYDNGILRTCTPKYYTAYDTTATTWSHTYQCAWKTQVTDTAVYYRTDQHVTR